MPKSELRFFADDTVLYRAIKSQHDQEILQEDLHNLTKWASDWQMDFNVSKCHLLRTTNKRKPHEFTYSANSEALKVSQCDYLGVRCSETLRWGAHCSKVAAKANKTLGLIRRTLKPCSREVKQSAYMMLVRPTLYKFHNGLVNCKFPDQVTRCTTSFTRSHCLSYQQLQSSVLAHSYSFFPRTIRVWNLLPLDVATSLSLNSFKQSAMPAIRSLKVPRHLRRL